MFGRKSKEFKFRHPVHYVPELFPIQPAIFHFSSVRKALAKGAKKELERSVEQNKIFHASASHLCSGIRGLIENSWILTLPFDLAITTNGDGISYEWETPVTFDNNTPPVDSFYANQWADHVQIPKNTLKTLVKIHTGWFVKCPENYSLMQMPLDVIGENRFSPFSGPLIGSKNYQMLNVILYWHELNSKVILKAGTPLCLLTPCQNRHFDMKNDFSMDVLSDGELKRINNMAKGIHCSWGQDRHIRAHQIYGD